MAKRLRWLMSWASQRWTSDWKKGWARKGMVRGRLLFGAWSEVAIRQCLIEKVEGSASSWYFKAGGHTTDGVDFEIRVFARTKLSSGVERRSCVFGEVS